MANCIPVKVIEKCKVAPPPGSVAVPVPDIPLTFFDQLWLPLPPPQNLFFYDYPYPSSLVAQSLIPQLKLSLSCTLIHFYPIAGNISWPHDSYRPLVRYVDGDAVMVTIAESDADFNSLSGDHPRDVNELHPFVPELLASGPIVPVLALQITIFPNFGISIGMTNSHSLVDGRAIAHFQRSWALMSKLGDATKALSTESPPFLDRTVIKDPTGIIEKRYLNVLETFMGSEMVSGNRSLRVMELQIQPDGVRATFELNPTNLRRLKDWILARHNKVDERLPEKFHMSSYVVTSAFAWVCLLKAKEAASELKTDSETSFVVHVDCRARMKMDDDLPIPGTYFGNFVRPFLVSTKTSDLLREDGVVVASRLIGEAIGRINNGLLSGLEYVISGLIGEESRDDSEGTVFGAGGSPQFGVYRVDFGWGRPKKVEFVSNDRTGGGMFMKESRKLDGGVEIDVVLNKEDMDAFASLFNGLRLIFD